VSAICGFQTETTHSFQGSYWEDFSELLTSVPSEARSSLWGGNYNESDNPAIIAWMENAVEKGNDAFLGRGEGGALRPAKDAAATDGTYRYYIELGGHAWLDFSQYRYYIYREAYQE